MLKCPSIYIVNLFVFRNIFLFQANIIIIIIIIIISIIIIIIIIMNYPYLFPIKLHILSGWFPQKMPASTPFGWCPHHHHSGITSRGYCPGLMASWRRGVQRQTPVTDLGCPGPFLGEGFVSLMELFEQPKKNICCYKMVVYTPVN